ncbi:unnamed protein product [Clonostachys rhizophaga]|uniref:Uncharacterized protein n=1 Tax=Clonostachys rhizophaga TaxID=160324 RepID=A0A9N9YLQ7_9HYPO|nr:unnamed protein product [Clonostachys rhizophaga]
MALDLCLLPQALVHHQTRPDRPLLRALLTHTRPTILHEGSTRHFNLAYQHPSSDCMPGARIQHQAGARGLFLYLEFV